MTDTSRYCTWTLNEWHDYWTTDCDREFCFIDGTATENDYKYCPACGKLIEEVKG